MQMPETLLSTSLNNELLEGEELIWSGRPVEYEKKAVSFPRSKLQNRALICVVLGLVLMVAAMSVEILIGDLSAGRESFILIPGFFIFIVGIYLYLLEKMFGFLMKPRLYAITNQRIIMLYGSGSIHIMSFNRRAIKQVQCFERPDGSGDLMFSGTPVFSGVYINARRDKRQYTLRAIPNVRLVERELLGGMRKVIDE